MKSFYDNITIKSLFKNKLLNIMKSFYDNITIKSLFKNKLLNIQRYFGNFSKKIIKSNSILSNSSQFWRVKIWGFMGI